MYTYIHTYIYNIHLQFMYSTHTLTYIYMCTHTRLCVSSISREVRNRLPDMQQQENELNFNVIDLSYVF